MPAIEVSGLKKAYGNLEAVRGIDFEIEAGEVFGLLGPNGAGKTTTVEILEGYREPRRRRGAVLGHDPERPGRRLPAAASVSCSRRPTLWPNLTVRETHARVRRLLQDARATSTRSIALVGLEEKAGARVKTLSGGQKRRLDLGVALVGDPELVFLDEPTTGFDPAARRAAWEMIRSLRSLGKTVLLTTHYLDEAEQLADRVAVIRDGVVVRDRHAARAHECRPRRRDPLPLGRRGRRRAHDRADARPRRAHGRRARARRGARRARGAAADARGRLPRPRRRRGARHEDVLAPVARRAAPLLALARVGGVHVHLPAAALRPARLGLLRPRLRQAGVAGSARGAVLATAARWSRSRGSRSRS